MLALLGAQMGKLKSEIAWLQVNPSILLLSNFFSDPQGPAHA